MTLPSFTALLVICCGVAFGGYLGSHMRLPVVPLYAHSLGADTVQIGLINSAFLCMAGVLSLPLGILSDRIGRKLLAAVGLLILALTSFLLYFSRSPAQLVWIFVLFGVGLAAFGPTMMSLVADISPVTHLGRSYGWYTTSLYSSMTLGPAIGGLMAQRLGFRSVFLVSAILIMAVFGLLVLLLPRSRILLASKKDQKKQPAGTATALIHNRPLLGCWLATLGGCFGLGMFVTFLPLHAQNQGLNVAQIGMVFFVQGLANAVSRIPFGHLSDKVRNRKNLVFLGFIGFAACMAGFGLALNLAGFLLFSIGYGASMGLAFTSVGALIAEAVPPSARGLAMGGYNTCIYFGMMLSSAAMGPVIRATGFANGFFITGIVNFSLIGFFYLLMRDFSPFRSEPTTHP
ncbi:MAG: MFS transporter [Desulforhabdus sp.]|nr:MFS transporter [Desulforhabdus sp.]